MLLMMLDRGEPIHSVVFFDTGWEFPGLLDHIDLLERRTGLVFIRLKPDKSFDYWMFKHYLPNQNRIGYGWPSPKRRWCTREKINAISRYVRSVSNPIECIGYAADEAKRAEKTIRSRIKNHKNKFLRFPLIEWDITEQQALKYCLEQGYNWSGLYNIFHRVSCFCCPLQRIDELKNLREHYPEFWKQMLDMDSRIDKNNGFRGNKTIHDLEYRFAKEAEPNLP